MKKFHKNSKKVLALVLACIMLLSVGSITFVINSGNKSKAENSKNDIVINILHTNDIHGEASNMSYVAKYSKETENAILVDAGDATQGKSIATYTQGDALIQLMNKAGYELSILGNHEFDYGLDKLSVNVLNAKFSFLAANVKKDNGKLLLENKKENGAYKIIEKAGKKIGFFGISTTETAYKTNPTNIKGIKFEPEIETAQKVADELNGKGCDLVVCLAHVGVDEETKVKSTDMAEKLTGVDVIIDGHSHSELQHKATNGTFVVQTGTELKTLGQITVTFCDNDTKIETKLLSDKEYKAYGKDEEVDTLYNELNDKLDLILGEVIGKTSTDLIANEINALGEMERIVRNRETSMGDLAADSMVWGAEKFLETTKYNNLAIVALTNGGGVRSNILAGNITIGDVFNVCPFSSTLSIKIVTPKVLYEALEFSVSSLSLDENNRVQGFAGSYPQISGMRFEMDLSKKGNGTSDSKSDVIVAVYLQNETGSETLLDRNDDNTKIAFASNNFIIAGGDGFTMLNGLEHIAEGNVLDEILGDYITYLTEKAGGCFEYKMDGNRSVEINAK